MMNRFNYSQGAKAERKQLLLLAGGFFAIATAIYWFVETAIFPTFFLTLSGSALISAVFYSTCGRAVFLAFALFSSFIARVISFVILTVMYFWAILVFGSLLRFFGMNKLERNFIRCRLRSSMFMNAPGTDMENFRRQS
jgi:hypothetical protein